VIVSSRGPKAAVDIRGVLLATREYERGDDRDGNAAELDQHQTQAAITTSPTLGSARMCMKTKIGVVVGIVAGHGRAADGTWTGTESSATGSRSKAKWKEMWGKLTDDDLDVIAGKQDQLEGGLQERYAYAKDQAKKKVGSSKLVRFHKEPRGSGVSLFNGVWMPPISNR